jgi:AcrR family transcriptional regulator
VQRRPQEEADMPDEFVVITPPRARILAAARDLFHRRGLRGVGVDAIAEAAGTNKMTLYPHFESKDELIVAYLRGVASEADDIWREIERDNPDDAQAQLRSWLKRAEDCITVDGRGFDLANAAVELTEAGHPARRLIEEMKTQQRDRLAKQCRRAGIPKSEMLADTLTLLLEGARVSRQAVGTNGPSAKFVSTAETVIETFKAMTKVPAKTSPQRCVR